jgi:hypothetical protein
VRLWRALFWEFVQNIPFVTGFILAISLWQQGEWSGWGAAIACIAVGSIVGSLLIRATESKIVAGHREPLRVVVANIAAMTVLMTAAVAYLSASWSSWGTDVLVGAVAGVALGIVQDLAAGNRIGVRHCVALGCAAPLALIGVRVLVATLPALANILIVTTVLTLIIGLIDYGPLASTKQDDKRS